MTDGRQGVMTVRQAALALGLSAHLVRALVGTGELRAGAPRRTANGCRALMTIDACSVESYRARQAQATQVA